MSRNKGHYDSRLFLGGYDEDLIQKPISYHKVIRKSWWTLSLDKLLINGKDSGFCDEDIKCEIIMDTGASLMATPPTIYEEFI